MWSPSLVSLYKEGLRYGWFRDEFSENVQNGFFTKTALDGCFYSFNLTIQNSYKLYRTFFIKYVITDAEETLHLQGEYSLIIYNCCYHFEETSANALHKAIF